MLSLKMKVDFQRTKVRFFLSFKMVFEEIYSPCKRMRKFMLILKKILFLNIFKIKDDEKDHTLFFVSCHSRSWLRQSQRFVMFEEFTNASCGPCASQNPAFDALLSANAHQNAPQLNTIQTGPALTR
jgi:hypothetical protein